MADVNDLGTMRQVMVTVEQAAQLLSISTPKCYELIAQGVIPSVRLGPRCTRISLSALEEWAHEATRKGTI
jgi:excisionase family DNA binding protein